MSVDALWCARALLIKFTMFYTRIWFTIHSEKKITNKSLGNLDRSWVYNIIYYIHLYKHTYIYTAA